MVNGSIRQLIMRALGREKVTFNRSWFEWELRDLNDQVVQRSKHLNTLETRAKYVAAHLYSRHTLDACTGWPVYAGAGAYVPSNIVDPDNYWTKPMCMMIEDTVGVNTVISRVHERGILTGTDQKIAYFKSTFAGPEGNWAPNYINKLSIATAEILQAQYVNDVGAGPPATYDLANNYAEIEAVLYDAGGTAADKWRYLERVEDYDLYVEDLTVKNRIELPNGNAVIAANDQLLFLYWRLPTVVSTATNRIAYKTLTDEIAKTVSFKLTVAWYVEFA